MGVKSVEIVIANALGDLVKAQKLIANLVTSERLPAEVEFQLNVVIDEILSNIIKYGYEDGGKHDIQLRLAINGDVLTLEIEDDGRPFDPLKVAAPDLDLPLAERPVGGLGLYFVRNLTDEAKYERIGGRNRLIFRKTIHR